MDDATHPTETALEELRRYLDPEMFRALGDPTRLALLARLVSSSGPQTVTELSDCCGVHLSGVSRHLKMLRDADLISAERSGREVLYDLDCTALAGTLRNLADALERCAESCRTGGGPCCDPTPTHGEKSDDPSSQTK